MPDMANLAGAMIFVVRNTMRVADSLRAKYEHRENQLYSEQTYGNQFAHVWSAIIVALFRSGAQSRFPRVNYSLAARMRAF